MLRFFCTSFVILFLMTGCFGGITKKGSVIGYSNNTVKTVGGSFRLGPLPHYWQQHKIKYRALLFVNSRDQSSITVDSWCQDAYDDGPLVNLTRQLLSGVDHFNILEQKLVQLAGRESLQTDGYGMLDGRQVFISAYVLKMNHCVFDFVYVTLPQERNYQVDFKSMVHGFQYVQGPDVL